MTIGIDISQIIYKTGVSRYQSELVKHLLKIDKTNNYHLFGSSLGQLQELRNYISNLDSNKNLQSFLYPIPVSMIELLFNRMHIGDIQNLVGKVDLFHSSDWTFPKTSAKKITTVHDMAVFIYPELFHPKIVSVQKTRLSLVKKECDQIIAVSENTKKDAVKYLEIDPNRIKVIYEAASSVFSPKDTKDIEKLKKELKINKPYILTVATFGARKNLDRLIKSFSKVKKNNNFSLVIVGQEIINDKDIISTRYLKDDQLAVLYSGAKVFVYPSIYEGFGLPVVEAMACGTPVVCSNTSSLPEVGGSAAFYFQPESERELTDKLEAVITLSDGEYQNLKQKSLSQSKKFSWAKSARETLNVYEEVVRDR